jgi:hypothetical protein
MVLHSLLLQTCNLILLILQPPPTGGDVVPQPPVNLTASEAISCTNIASVDFRNTEVESSSRVFHFRNGEAYNYDAPPDSPAEQKPDWKSIIIGDTTVHPTPGVAVRFLGIESEHLTGSGSILYVLGFRCVNSTSKRSPLCSASLPCHLEKVFERSGGSLKVETLDNVSITIGMLPYYGKSVVKHWSYKWNETAHRYVTKSVWLTHLTEKWLAEPQFRN